jgi:hypothetical protein
MSSGDTGICITIDIHQVHDKYTLGSCWYSANEPARMSSGDTGIYNNIYLIHMLYIGGLGGVTLKTFYKESELKKV